MKKMILSLSLSLMAFAGQDFNADGVADLLWENSQTNTRVIWFMDENGQRDSYKVLSGVSSDWGIAGVHDFNGDGVSDLVWRNKSDGQNVLWYMNSDGTKNSLAVLGKVSLDWRIDTIADFNKDGIGDIFWRNIQTGANAVWIMNANGTKSALNNAGSVSVDWQVIGSHEALQQSQQIASTVTSTGTLSDEQKYSLAYMWNEEKLAKDIYLALNTLTAHSTLYNIATRSETQHESAVEQLIQNYDINITNLSDYTVNYSEEELRAFAQGEFAIEKVQSLYDILYAKGSQSLQDALEVGCMVEVTDINDLDEYIEVAGDKEDLVTVFTNLRSGSYEHYWAFDNALKNIGVSSGCCAVGEDYCKPDYPQSSSGSTNGNGNGYQGGH
jgi:hypothetical protein